jgi:hypothetical protein
MALEHHSTIMKESILYKNNNDEIKIIDNFFSNAILDQIIDYFNTTNWKCQCVKDINVNLHNDSPYWRIQLEKEYFFNLYLKNIIQKYFNKNLIPKRIYVVGQTYGQDSNFHIDDIDTNTYTLCFYINTIENNDHCDNGIFYIKIPNKKYIINVEPIMNRAIIFPSTYTHKGSGYNRFNNNLRICIAWKFKIIE